MLINRGWLCPVCRQGTIAGTDFLLCDSCETHYHCHCTDDWTQMACMILACPGFLRRPLDCEFEMLEPVIIDRRAIDLSGMDLSGHFFYAFDLENADLSDARLSYAELSLSNLRCANLERADLSSASMVASSALWACFTSCCLEGADLRDADLRYIWAEYANLRTASLHGADLRGANFFGADLRGADLRETNLRGTNLRDTLLDGALFERCLGREHHTSNWSQTFKLWWQLFITWLHHKCRYLPFAPKKPRKKPILPHIKRPQHLIKPSQKIAEPSDQE